MFAFLALTTIALDYGLHHLLTDSGGVVPTECGTSSRVAGEKYAPLLLAGVGGFLVTLSAVQLIISQRNPPTSYTVRYLVGIALGAVAWTGAISQFAPALWITLGAILFVTVNDTYGWGREQLRRAGEEV